MLRYCCYHKKYFGYRKFIGFKNPMENTSETDTICWLCNIIERIEEVVHSVIQKFKFRLGERK
jgi:hypothetical protein